MKMNLTIDKLSTGNFSTELCNKIKSIPEEKLFYKEHSLKHPLAIYYSSTYRLLESFNSVSRLLLEGDVVEATDKHKELIERLVQYRDDGYLIFKTIFSPTKTTSTARFANRWLERINKIRIQNNAEQLKPYVEYYESINNKLKHNNAELFKITMYTIYGKIHGYYVTGASTDGHIIPDNEIHQDFEGNFTAISLNYDLKNILVNFYCMSNIMARTLDLLYYDEYSSHLDVTPTVEKQDDAILNMITKINELPNLFFPDEYEKQIPQIQMHSDKIIFRSDAYASFKKKLPRYNGGSVRTVLSFDGVSKTYALPYFNSENTKAGS